MHLHWKNHGNSSLENKMVAKRGTSARKPAGNIDPNILIPLLNRAKKHFPVRKSYFLIITKSSKRIIKKHTFVRKSGNSIIFKEWLNYFFFTENTLHHDPKTLIPYFISLIWTFCFHILQFRVFTCTETENFHKLLSMILSKS